MTLSQAGSRQRDRHGVHQRTCEGEARGVTDIDAAVTESCADGSESCVSVRESCSDRSCLLSVVRYDCADSSAAIAVAMRTCLLLAVCLALLAVSGASAASLRRHQHKLSPASSSASAAVTPSSPLDRELTRLRTDPQVQSDADSIINLLVNGEMKGATYDRLANFTDTIGPRVCGSDILEGAVSFMLDRLKEDGLENVHAEQTALLYWRRGAESATLIEPRVAKLNMLGLGGSIGTQAYEPKGLTAEVLVVSSFDDLTAKAAEAKGKIVLFHQYCDWVNNPVSCYGTSVVYREIGAQAVAAVGGLASLIRSVASFSINSPHTGMISPGTGPQVPTAALTIEDTEMLQRMSDRGQKIVINLQMEATMVSTAAVGHNVVAEWTGTELPNEVVIVSGHLDSWDVGQGAMDDGGGMAISWSVLSALKRLNLRAKRTIRFVAWSCEEMGGIGASQYYQAHQAEVPTMSMVMESDMGVFHPTGLQFTGGAAATSIMTTIGGLLSSINATSVVGGGDGTDIAPWMSAGVPGASLLNDNERYFCQSAGLAAEVFE